MAVAIGSAILGSLVATEATIVAGGIIAGSILEAGIIGVVAETVGASLLASGVGMVAGGLASTAIRSAFTDSPSAPQSVASSAQTARGILLNTSGTIDPINVIYGTRKVGGTLVYAEASGASNEYLHLVLALCEGEISAINTVYLDDVDSADASFGSLVTIEKYVGTDAQTASAALSAACAAWDSPHTLAGTAYVYVKLEYSADVFHGIPTITCDVAGKLVFDPRDSLTKYSSNPALCIRDYLLNARYGRGIPATAIDDDTIIAAANICDTQVDAGPGTRPAYTCDGVVNTDAAPLANLSDLLTSCRGFLVYSGGKYKLKLDVAGVAAFAFTEDNIVGQWSIKLPEKRNRANRVRATFFDPDNNWQPNIAVQESSTYRAEDNDVLLEQEFSLPFSANVYTAQQIAQQALKQSRKQTLVQFTATIAGLRCEVGDLVTITHSTPGWDAKVFRVMRLALLASDEVEVTALEYDAAVYNLDPLALVSPLPGTNLADPLTVGTPSALTVAVENITQPDGTIIPRLVANWTAPADAFVVGYEVAWREDAGPWDTTTTMVTRWLIPASVTGRVYDVRVRAINSLGVRGAWVSTDGTTCTAPATAPAAPAATATGGMFVVHLAWTFGDSRQDVRGTEVWWSATNDRTAAARLTFEPFPGREYNHVGLSAGQGGYYWLRVVDTFGNYSAWYPSGATAGLYALATSDPSALLTQLRTSLGLDQMAAELAAPIQIIEAGNLQNAIVGIENALSDYDLTARVQWQEAITNATVTVDPETGQIQLLATAAVTTDVEARLTQAELDINAADATLSAQVATLTTVEGDLTAAQSAITLLQSSVAIGASEIYVENAVGNALGGINVTSANAYSNLAQAEIKSALEMFDTQQAATSINGTVAAALETLQAHADAIASEVTVRTSLVSAIAANAAAIVSEQTTRANAVSAEADARLALASRVTSAEGTITTHGSAISNMYTKSQVDGSISGLSTTLTTNYQNADAAVYTNAQSYVQAYSYSKSHVDSSEAGLSTTLTTNYQNADATVYSNAQSYVNTYAYSKAGADGVIASSVAVVSARLDSGDYAAVKTQSSASANAITGLQAKYGVKVDVNGHVTGFEILGSATSGDFVILADKFLICKPDGTGTPKQVLMLGTVNGTTALGLDGSLIIDGSIVARSIDTRNLSVKDGSGNVILSSGQKLTGTWIADLAVDTLQIAGNAVTLPVSAYTSGAVYQTGGWGDIQVQTLSITTTSRPVLIVASFYLDSTYYGVPRYPTIKILRDGTEIYSLLDEFYNLKSITISFTDTPGTGAHTYSITVSTAAGTDNNISKRSLLCMEVKK